MNKTTLTLALALLATPAYADDVSVWLDTGMYSRHDDRDAGYRENNSGVGFEVAYSKVVSFHAGVYQNSEDLESNYVAIGYTPYSVGNVHMGLLFTAVTGYRECQGGVAIVPLPYAHYEYKSVGVNLIWVPTQVVAVQFKIKLGE